jgi:DNA-binding helix-hairpin-helix protein with protein kinase domain
MNTPVDKPDLPAVFPARIASFQVDSTMRTYELSTYDETDMRTYGRMCADEREAWARADERRKVLEEAETRIRQRLEAAVRNYEITAGPYSEGAREAYTVAVADIQSMMNKEPRK